MFWVRSASHLFSQLLLNTSHLSYDMLKSFVLAILDTLCGCLQVHRH